MNVPLATEYTDSLIPCPCGYVDCYSTYITSRPKQQWEMFGEPGYERMLVVEYGSPPHRAMTRGQYVYRPIRPEEKMRGRGRA